MTTEYRLAEKRWGVVYYKPKRDMAHAVKGLADLRDAHTNRQQRYVGSAPEAWIETREISPWTRVVETGQETSE